MPNPSSQPSTDKPKHLSPEEFSKLPLDEKLNYLYVSGDPFQRWVIQQTIRRFGIGAFALLATIYGVGQCLDWIYHLVVMHIHFIR